MEWLVPGLLALLSCSPVGQVLEVELLGAAPAATVQIASRLDERELPGAEIPASAAGRFVVQLPAGARGRLLLQVAGLDGTRCLIAAGQAEVSLPLALSPQPLSLALSPLPADGRGCQVRVDYLGEPAGGTVSLRLGPEGGEALCAPSCRFDLPPPQEATLQARARPGFFFAGWSGACAGLDDCALSGQNDLSPRRAGATFQPERVCGPDGWCWEYPRPQGFATLRRIFAVNARDVWAVGAEGLVLRFNGSWWTPLPSGTRRILFGIWGSGPEDVYIVGDGGVVLRWDGEALRRAGGVPAGAAGVVLRAVWGSGPGDVWIGGETGLLLHGGAGGFVGVDSGGPGPVRALWGSGPANIWASGRHYDGRTWTLAPAIEGADDLWGSDAQHVFAVQGGRAVAFDGATWRPLPDLSAPLNAVWGSAPADVWFFGSGGAILRWDGSRLRDQGLPGLGLPILGAGGASPYDIWAVGPFGLRLHFSGLSWLRLEEGAALPMLNAISGRGSQVWAVGGAGTILRRDGERLLPAAVSGSSSEALRAVWAGAGRAYIVAESKILSVDRTGKTLQEEVSMLPGSLPPSRPAIFGFDQPLTVYAVSGQPEVQPKVYHYQVEGWTTEQAMVPAGSSLEAVWGVDPATVYAGGQTNGGQALLVRRQGALWMEVPFPKERPMGPVRAIWGSGAGVWFATQHEMFRLVGTTISQLPGRWGDIMKAHFFPPDDLWLVDSGALTRGRPGEALQPVDLGTSRVVSGVWGQSANDLWVAGAAGMVLHRAP